MLSEREKENDERESETIKNAFGRAGEMRARGGRDLCQVPRLREFSNTSRTKSCKFLRGLFSLFSFLCLDARPLGMFGYICIFVA